MTDIVASGRIASASRSGPIAVQPIIALSDWQDLMARVPAPHLTQAHAYGEARRTSGWTPIRVVFEIAGRPVAICQILEKRIAGIRLLSRVSRGPLFLDATPSPETIQDVYSALKRGWGRLGKGALVVAPSLESTPENLALMRAAGFRVLGEAGWVSAQVDLTRSEDNIIGSFQPNFRNKLRKCDKLDIGIRVGNEPELVEWMIARHEENKRDKAFSAVDDRFLRVLRDASGEDFTILQAIHEGRPVAGISVIRYGLGAEYFVAWFGPDGRAINAGNFLLWQAIRHMKSQGVATLDLGGLDPNTGYSTFKRGLRPREYTLIGECLALL
jgi:hypothetical protein